MTRRQIYFYIPERNTYYVSDEFNGDKTELERMGSRDFCEVDWSQIMERLAGVSDLADFLRAISTINYYYHSAFGTEKPGSRLRVAHSREEIGQKDQTYGIVDGKPGAFLDKELSIWEEVA